MAIEAKVDYLNQVEKRLSTEVTADTMARVMGIIADVLEGYDLRAAFERTDAEDDLLECYIDALTVQGRSPKTVARYRYVITRMMQSVTVPTRRITVYHLRSYLAELQKGGCADSTAEGIREVITAYFNWLQRESLIDRNPAANLGAIKCAKKKKQTLSDLDMYKLKGCCESTRDMAIIMFLAATGCRVSEMTELDRDAIDYAGMQCVVHGKGNKERSVFLDNVTANVLKKYISERSDNCPALFVNRFGERIRPDGVRYILREIAKRAGVEHVHPHKFRRTLATELARHGMPVQEVAYILGHDKLDTTMQYVIQNDTDVRNSYMRYAA